MLRVTLFFFLVYAFSCYSDDRTRWNDQIVPLPPLSYYNSRYESLEDDVERRFEDYFGEKDFSCWQADRKEQEIEEEFLNLSAVRGAVWFDSHEGDIERSWREDFRPALEMMREDVVRNPNCIAFDYNKVSPYYNGSLVTVNGLRFLSLEGPLEKSVQRFFYTLLDTNAPLLVRLTPEREHGVEKCAAYWKGRVEDGQIAIPRHLGSPKRIHYLATDDWQDNSPANADLLLDMVLQARKLHDPSKGPLAVHCSGGVGRSGTFIAAYALIAQIDALVNSGTPIDEISISIEKLVAQLSLQRYHMVARPSQYLNLYQVVSQYLQMLREDTSNRFEMSY